MSCRPDSTRNRSSRNRADGTQHGKRREYSKRRETEHGTEMETFLRAITDGVLEGGVYGLMAVGLTLIFGVLDLINIAQGIMVVLGAYLSYVLWTHLHIDVFVGLLITIPAMFILGVAIQYLFIRPLRGRE